jgi:hypothetical protein
VEEILLAARVHLEAVVEGIDKILLVEEVAVGQYKTRLEAEVEVETDKMPLADAEVVVVEGTDRIRLEAEKVEIRARLVAGTTAVAEVILRVSLRIFLSQCGAVSCRVSIFAHLCHRKRSLQWWQHEPLPGPGKV